MDDEIEYVGFWARVVASLVDTVCALMIIGPVLWAVYGRDYFDMVEGKLVAGPVDLLIQYVFPAVAIIAFWLTRQATPGKMVIGARVSIRQRSASSAPGKRFSDTSAITFQ